MTDLAQPSARSSNTESYWLCAQAPLQALIFLAPLALFYELGVVLLNAPNVRTAIGIAPFENLDSALKARRHLFDLFEWLGFGGYYLPGLMLGIVLLSLHLVRRDRWQFQPRLYWLMWAESLALVLPLFVFGLVMARFLIPILTAGEPGPGPHVLDRIVLSVGAGIYEEMVFRLMAIALLHGLIVDWLKIDSIWGPICTIFITALAFAFYHFSETNPFSVSYMVFYTIAGIYFAGIYLLRGFGIVVAVHAIYDILVVVMDLQLKYDQ